ncbi:MAG: hypothetical protein HYZ28_10680 [Myxococcales bacterium]|nr:hypothetical protein [Myxococcales bacterium]
MRPMLPLLALGLFSCAGSSASVANAVANTTIALMSSGASRAMGGCYASCPTGTRCNGDTGLCDPLPCRGECPSGFVCEEIPGRAPQCVQARRPPADNRAFSDVPVRP